MNLVVPRLTYPFGDGTHEKNRKCAINKETVPHVMGIEGRIVRIKIFCDRLWEAEAAFDHGEKSFIRVVVTMRTPIQSRQTQRRRKDKN